MAFQILSNLRSSNLELKVCHRRLRYSQSCRIYEIIFHVAWVYEPTAVHMSTANANCLQTASALDGNVSFFL